MRYLSAIFLFGAACAAFLLLACSGPNTRAEAPEPEDPSLELALARDGSTDYRIVHADDAPEAVRLAARQLSDHLASITGADFPVSRESPENWSSQDPLIVLGTNAWTRRQGIATPDDEGYRFKTVGRALCIVGDDGAGDPLDLENRAGTLIGVFDFLRRHFDAEWFLPGKEWAVLPESPNARIPRLDERHGHAFPMRGLRNTNINFMPDDIRKERRRRFQLWARTQGAGSTLQGQPGHNTHRVMAPWTTKNGGFTGPKAWLALVDGKRRTPNPATGPKGWYGTWHGVKPALTHPEVVDIHIDWAREFADKNPESDILPMGLSDGPGYDESEKAKAMDAEGTDQITDRIMTFYAKIGGALAESHPDRYVGTYAYKSYREPPKQLESIPDNLFLMYVRNNTAFLSDAERTQTLDELKRWGDFTENLAYFSYPVSMGFFGLPATQDAFPQRLFARLEAMGALGLRDMSLNAVYSIQADPYVIARLMNDPDADAKRLADRFHSRLYGPAAEAMRSYHHLIREAHTRYRNTTEITTGEFDGVRGLGSRILGVFLPIRSEARALLDEAAEAAEGRRDIAYRVGVARKQWTLTELFVRVAEVGPQIDGTMPTDDPHAAEAELERLRKRFYDFLREHGNTDVVQVHSIANLRFTRDTLAKWLRFDLSLNKKYQRPYEAIRSEWKGSLYRTPREALAAETVMTLPMEWRFRTDPKDEGRGPPPDNWAHPSTWDHPDWETIRVDAPWTEQGYDHHGAAWYRTTFDVPETVDPRAQSWLLFHAVDGDFEVWLNGRRIATRKEPLRSAWDQPRAVPAKGRLQPGQTNKVVVRVEKHSRAAGIWKPVELRVAGKE